MQYSKENLIKLIIYLEPETRTIKVPHPTDGVYVYDTKRSHIATIFIGSIGKEVPIEKALSFLWAYAYRLAFQKAEREMHEKKVDAFLTEKVQGLI